MGGCAEFERLKETLDVLRDPDLMRQVQESGVLRVREDKHFV